MHAIDRLKNQILEAAGLNHDSGSWDITYNHVCVTLEKEVKSIPRYLCISVIHSQSMSIIRCTLTNVNYDEAWFYLELENR